MNTDVGFCHHNNNICTKCFGGDKESKSCDDSSNDEGEGKQIISARSSEKELKAFDFTHSWFDKKVLI